MKKYYPDGSLIATENFYGWCVAQTMVQVIKQAGNDLTRTNVMKQAASLKNFAPSCMLPGIKINTSATDFYPIQAVRLARVKGESFELFGDVLSNESPSQ
jgi:branched-chain amino acid transport system substrate-binding protein